MAHFSWILTISRWIWIYRKFDIVEKYNRGKELILSYSILEISLSYVFRGDLKDFGPKIFVASPILDVPTKFGLFDDDDNIAKFKLRKFQELIRSNEFNNIKYDDIIYDSKEKYIFILDGKDFIPNDFAKIYNL